MKVTTQKLKGQKVNMQNYLARASRAKGKTKNLETSITVQGKSNNKTVTFGCNTGCGK